MSDFAHSYPLEISVIFSSYNGAKRLVKTLESFASQDFPADRWELLAVDNNSSDNSFEIMQSYSARMPIKPARHLVPGKSGAVNSAIDRASGKMLLFTDDDVDAAPDLLSQIVECARLNPEFDIFGGRIVPDWEHFPRGEAFLDWIPQGSTFAIIDETESGPCESTKIWGPNTTIRRAALGDRRYREDIGPFPGKIYAMGEDQEIVMRLAAQGAKCFRCADALVRHFIPASNTTEIWVQQRAERLGYGVPALFPEDVPAGPRIAGVPVATWMQSLGWYLRAALLTPTPKSRLRFWAIWKSYYMRGYRRGIRTYATPGGLKSTVRES